MFLSRCDRKRSVKKNRRRVPAQERSRERVARVLDAAAHEFAERGVEAATVESIAERARTSVGSIYQFFPNKRALYEAIGDLYLEEVRVLFAAMVSDDTVRASWRQVVSAAIDGFAAMHRTSVTFRAVWSNVLYSRRFLHAGQALNRELAERAEVVFAQLARKKIAPARRKLMATVAIETISALLLLANDQPRAQGDALLGEAKVIVERYLEPFLD
jgi:AcrR family transcriptional regulator